MINAETDLATQYNDRSVLESHHSAFAFRIMKKPENNILINMTPEEKKEFRSFVISGILSTDMVSFIFLFFEKYENSKLRFI